MRGHGGTAAQPTVVEAAIQYRLDCAENNGGKNNPAMMQRGLTESFHCDDMSMSSFCSLAADPPQCTMRLNG